MITLILRIPKLPVMATIEEHQKLASFIKEVHQCLRIQTSLVGFQKAWENHCQQKDVLQQYAITMHKLATEHWDKNLEDGKSGVMCRIHWIYSHMLKYFDNDIHTEREKENKKAIYFQNKFMKENVSSKNYTEILTVKDKYNVLDVGSCYNPFKFFPRINVTPIDIAPASSDVFSCDFLNVGVGICDFALHGKSTLTKLPENYFNAVVFSLLLEYLPSPEQRFECCFKAYSLLKFEGLLFIISPDSKHATANSVMIKDWRLALADIGFMRVYYEKLPHIHCMAYRKCLNVHFPKQWASHVLEKDKKKGRNVQNITPAKLYIPQDFGVTESNKAFTNISGHSQEICNEKCDTEDTVAEMFKNLPMV